VISNELPPSLHEAIDRLVRTVERSRLEAAALRLTAAYREGGNAPAARTREDVLAYAAQRAPATYAAAAAALRPLAEQRPGWQPRSLLDVGAGPGTASWAARAVWPGLERLVLVEAEPAMVALGRELDTDARIEWVAGELRPMSEEFDLVLAAYVLNELPSSNLEAVARSLWASTADTLVVLEPGTPAGYRNVLATRAEAIAAGGFTIAPCPHDEPCPLVAPDWCHFAARLQRSEAHRSVKAASRGFEDEKFSYAALAREPQPRAAARIVRPPQVRPGHVLLELCEPGGVGRTTVSRRDRESFRRARKAAWGDAFEPTSQAANIRSPPAV
jgi:ribosomal protein RSM22 (predicted rRNA methylase)